MSLTSYRAALPRDRAACAAGVSPWDPQRLDRLGMVIVLRDCFAFLSRSGGDLLSHVLRRSTIGATALNGRVRDGIGCFARAKATRPEKKRYRRYPFGVSVVQGCFWKKVCLLPDQIKPIEPLVPVN